MNTVVLKPSAAKQFSNLSKKDAAKVSSKIEGLRDNPFPVGSKKLKGADNVWRLRFGNYRILYLPPDSAGKVVVLSVANRAEAYKLL